MSLWEAIVLGIVQGLTEFLPISSTAHLLIARQLLGHENPSDAFTTAIQLGTLVAVFLYFRNDIIRLAHGWLGDLKTRRLGSNPEAKMCWMIVAGTIPVVTVGLLGKDFIKSKLYSSWVIAGAAIFFALLLWVAELAARRRKVHGEAGRTEEKITWFDAMLVGCFQALALIPGASRSGVTITAGLFAGLSRASAARFSFLLSLPSIFAAGLYDAYKDRHNLFRTESDIANLLVGAAVAGIVGYLSIAWLLGFLQRFSTYSFIVYRILLGLVMLGLLAMGYLR